jgi:cytochrome c-type biogenesis protein CcmH
LNGCGQLRLLKLVSNHYMEGGSLWATRHKGWVMVDWTFWGVAACVALLVTATLILAARRNRGELRGVAEFDLSVYRDQLAEIERDMERGVLVPEEAQRLRTEISRRLLDADRGAKSQPVAGGSASRLGLMAVIAVVIAGSVALYDRLGAPGYPDLPLKARFAMSEELRASRPSQAEAASATTPAAPRTDVDPAFLDLMDKLRATLKDRPDDIAGLTLLARNEAALGNIAAATAAQSALIAVKGTAATAEDQASLAELMILAAGGYVSPETEEVLMRALALDATNGTARYYSGVMFAQIGRFDRTFVLWRALLEESPADAPWIAPIREQLPEVAMRAGVNYTLPDAQRGPSAQDVAAAAEMTAEDRQAMISGMVAQLGERLATEGGPAEDWARLISSLGVLGRTDEAREIYAEAQKRFAGQSVELAGLREAAVTAGVAE